MTPSTLLELTAVAGCPKVKINLPVPLRKGDHVKLDFRLKRLNSGRQEQLVVRGEFRVTSATVDAEHQYLAVESTGKEPSWRAVKREALVERRIAPTHFPRTLVR